MAPCADGSVGETFTTIVVGFSEIKFMVIAEP